MERILGGCRARFERSFCLAVVGRLSAESKAALLEFINTLLIQNILKDPVWERKMTAADRRGLSPLFWSHANLYGRIDIDIDRHIDLGLAA